MLSHKNLMANAGQIFAYGADFFEKRETLFNPLPAFHSFGLTAGTLFPLFNGFKVVFYPSPLHFKQVPKLIGETKSTILLGTDTFLTGYIRAADDGDLESVKLVVAGAEKVKRRRAGSGRICPQQSSRAMAARNARRFSPATTPRRTNPHRRAGFAGVEWEIHPVAGIEEGGRLHAHGPNVMLGYMFASDPGKIQPQGEWHDTGDIVAVDEMGRIAIRGRAKRFAKIGGEMVSLAAVESLCGSLWPEIDPCRRHIARCQERRADRARDRSRRCRSCGTHRAFQGGRGERTLPAARGAGSRCHSVLGSGKIDYVGAAEVAKSMRAMI